MSLEAELAAARDLDVEELAATIEAVGFECTRCGACCRGDDDGPHTATVFPSEVRTLRRATGGAWRDVARPMPFGLGSAPDGSPTGSTFEWAIGTDACGDCRFYDDSGEVAACSVYADRPRICRTYPFATDLISDDIHGEVVETRGRLRVHECEGLGRDISREDARELARAVKERTVREIEEAIAVRDNYRRTAEPGVVVYDSEGPKRPDGTPLDG